MKPGISRANLTSSGTTCVGVKAITNDADHDSYPRELPCRAKWHCRSDVVPIANRPVVRVSAKS